MGLIRMIGRRTCLPLIFTFIIATGCMPRTFVRKNPSDCDKGIRYYRPKPYLALKPATDKDGKPVAGHVEISLAYLPDFSEEYSIHMRTGFGVNNTNITLYQGWNLTGLNVQLDSKTSENIEAIGSALSGVAGLAKAMPSNDSFDVTAKDVPLGYYEAVIGKQCGRKHLYGFRYVGFMPFATCPMVACGTPQPYDCMAMQSELFGLVFDKKGVMTFKSLSSLNKSAQQLEIDATLMNVPPSTHERESENGLAETVLSPSPEQ